MDNQLGYRKYDYNSKQTENSRNGSTKQPSGPTKRVWDSKHLILVVPDRKRLLETRKGVLEIKNPTNVGF